MMGPTELAGARARVGTSGRGRGALLAFVVLILSATWFPSWLNLAGLATRVLDIFARMKAYESMAAHDRMTHRQEILRQQQADLEDQLMMKVARTRSRHVG